jgi:alcohol dehydrogenase
MSSVRRLPQPRYGSVVFVRQVFHLAVDASADPERLRKALGSVMPEGHVNSVGIYFEDVALPMLPLYLRGVHFHNGKGHARPNMTPTLDAVAAGVLHPDLITSGIYGWDEIPEVLTSDHPGHKPIFVLDR